MWLHPFMIPRRAPTTSFLLFLEVIRPWQLAYYLLTRRYTRSREAESSILTRWVKLGHS